MARRSKTLPRTLQYWKLTNPQDVRGLVETDWSAILGDLRSHARKQTIDGQEVTGSVHTLAVPPEIQDALRTDDAPDAPVVQDRTNTFGVMLAGNKDYVPNQHHRDTGAQQAMYLAGDNWDPVDNLFVWFCPFGNMFGIISESVSSPRARIFAEWLTKVLHDEEMAPHPLEKFSLEAEPVIDPDRAKVLNQANGLKSLNVAGNFGNLVMDASGVSKLFGGRAERIGALRVEVKVTTVRGTSTEEDARELLNFYKETFGPLAGDVLKAKVNTAPDYQADIPATEIDLLKHRLTRSTNVQLTNGVTRAFEARSTLQQIVSAFDKDRSDLLRIRNDLMNTR